MKHVARFQPSNCASNAPIFSANFAPFCNYSFVILSVIKLLITHFHCGIYPAFSLFLKHPGFR